MTVLMILTIQIIVIKLNFCKNIKLLGKTQLTVWFGLEKLKTQMELYIIWKILKQKCVYKIWVKKLTNTILVVN